MIGEPNRPGGPRGRLALASIGTAAGLGLLLTGGGAYLTVAYLRAPAVALQHGPRRAVPAGAPEQLLPLLAQLPADIAPGTPIAVDAPSVPRRPAAARRHGTWIEIPDLGIALPIQEGQVNGAIQPWVAEHFPTTVPPGQPGNSYLYAHGLWGMFGGLIWASRGQAVQIHDYETGRVLTFHVTRVIGAVRWNDYRWIDTPSAKPMLTLQTCLDYNPHGDRWIVEAA